MVDIENNIGGEERWSLPSDYITFEYQGNSYTVKKLPIKQLPTRPIVEEVARLQVVDQTGTPHGIIDGIFIKNHLGEEVEFESRDIGNTKMTLRESPNGGVFYEKQPGHVAGLIREVIAQVLIQGKVKEWISSPGLSDGGRKTYEMLLADPRLQGKREFMHHDGRDLHYYSLSKRR